MLNCARPCHDMQRIDVQCTYKYSWSMRKCMCMIHTRWAFCALLTLFGWRLTCRTRDGADSRSHRWTSARTQGLVFLFGQAVVRGLWLYCLCSFPGADFVQSVSFAKVCRFWPGRESATCPEGSDAQLTCATHGLCSVFLVWIPILSYIIITKYSNYNID